MTKPMQDELEGIFANALAHSLDVERKHAQDKKSASVKVMSVARASRNSILQRYRLQRNVEVEIAIASRAQASEDLYVNS